MTISTHKYSVNENRDCLIYDTSRTPLISVENLVAGQTGENYPQNNAVVAILSGKISCTFPDGQHIVYRTGQMVFISIGDRWAWYALEDSHVIVYRLLDADIRLCGNFPTERLLDKVPDIAVTTKYKSVAAARMRFGVVNIHPRLMRHIYGTRDSIADGVSCKRFLEIEIERFFLLLRLYYTREDLYIFLHSVLTGNVSFTEHVRRHWKDHRTVGALAESMSLSPKYFTRKFKSYFGENPHQWIAQKRAAHLFGEMTSTDKPLKLIASENGFGSFRQLASFTKKMLGKTPTEIRDGRDKND